MIVIIHVDGKYVPAIQFIFIVKKAVGEASATFLQDVQAYIAKDPAAVFRTWINTGSIAEVKKKALWKEVIACKFADEATALLKTNFLKEYVLHHASIKSYLRSLA